MIKICQQKVAKCTKIRNYLEVFHRYAQNIINLYNTGLKIEGLVRSHLFKWCVYRVPSLTRKHIFLTLDDREGLRWMSWVNVKYFVLLKLNLDICNGSRLSMLPQDKKKLSLHFLNVTFSKIYCTHLDSNASLGIQQQIYEKNSASKICFSLPGDRSNRREIFWTSISLLKMEGSWDDPAWSEPIQCCAEPMLLDIIAVISIPTDS